MLKSKMKVHDMYGTNPNQLVQKQKSPKLLLGIEKVTYISQKAALCQKATRKVYINNKNSSHKVNEKFPIAHTICRNVCLRISGDRLGYKNVFNYNPRGIKIRICPLSFFFHVPSEIDFLRTTKPPPRPLTLSL